MTVLFPRSRSRSRTAMVMHGAVDPTAAPDEQDVLVDVAAIADAVSTLGYQPVTLPLTLDLDGARTVIERLKPAFVFNLVEAIGGQGRLIHLATALLDSMGVPYTGCRTEAMFLTSNKPLAKRMMTQAGIETPAWIDPDRLGGTRVSFPGPYIVKSVWEHASIGLDGESIVADSRRLGEVARKRRRTLGGEWFAEAFVDGREFNVSVIAGPRGPEVLPPAEMRFIDFPAEKPRIVDYAAKWDEHSFEYANTVRSFDLQPEDTGLVAKIAERVKACWRLFGLSGYARVDFRVDAAGVPYVLEVNANPCISPEGGLVAAAARAGLNQVDLVARIIADAGVGRMGRRIVASAPQTEQVLAAAPA
jgi:D-alanine-D-alanine ligase